MLGCGLRGRGYRFLALKLSDNQRTVCSLAHGGRRLVHGLWGACASTVHTRSCEPSCFCSARSHKEDVSIVNDWAPATMQQSIMCNSNDHVILWSHQSSKWFVGVPCSLSSSGSRLELHIVAVALPTLHLLQPIHLFDSTAQSATGNLRGLQRRTNCNIVKAHVCRHATGAPSSSNDPQAAHVLLPAAQATAARRHSTCMPPLPLPLPLLHALQSRP
jgi:hypothetical protein